MTDFLGRRPASVPAVLALLSALAFVLLSIALPRPAAAEIHQITEGELNWGVKESWRNYVGGGHVSEGAELNADGTIKFPLESGTYDDETRTTVLDFDGQVWFRSWWEYTAPGKWALDTTYRDLRIVISPTEQVIRGTHIGYDQSDPGGELHVDEDVILGRLDVGGATPSFDGGTTRWPDVTTLAGTGLRIYSAGSLIDPASFSYAGPGGIPDLGEHFDRPGYVSLHEQQAHTSDWERESHTASSQRLFAAGDGSGLTFAEIKSANNASTVLRLTRLDPETLETIGTPLVIDDYPVFNGNRFYGRYFRIAHDPERDEVYFLKGGMGEDELGVWLLRARWDADSGEFVVDKIGEMPPATINDAGNSVTHTPASMAVWNDVLDEVAIISTNPDTTDLYDRHALYRFQRSGDDWTRVVSVLRAPDDGEWAGASSLSTPWARAAGSTTIVNYNDIAIARDGSYVLPSATASITQPDPENPGTNVRTNLPSAHLAIDGDDVTPAYIPGTIAAVHAGFGTYYGWSSASRSYDGSVYIHNSQWGMDAFVRVDVEDGVAATVDDVYYSQVDSTPPYLTATLGRMISSDPWRGWDWVVDVSDPDGWVFNAFRRDGDEDVMFSRHKQPEMLAHSVYGAAPVVSPNGDVYLIVRDADTERASIRRFDYKGVLATFAEQPESKVVSLENGEENEAVVFSASVTGGEPAPSGRWQVKGPGESQFVDLEGESGEELTVEATREADGSEFRAVYESPAGTIATEPATLEVRFAPQVVNEPADATVEPGEPATFVAMPAGNPQPEIDWQVRVGGIWQSVDPESGQFEVSGEHGGFLKVGDTSLELSGTKFRARLRNKITPGSERWSTTFSRAATLTVSAPAEEPLYFDPKGSTVDWGISGRFRCYVTGSIAQGEIATSGPVTQIEGTRPSGPLCSGTNPATGKPWGTGGEAFRFGLGEPVFEGSEPVAPLYDPVSGKLRIDLGGSVRFLGHSHHSPDGEPLLDTRISNVRIEANMLTGEGLIYADAVGATMSDPEPVTHDDVKLAYFDASELTLGPVDGRVRIESVPTFLHADGTVVFGDYPEGEPLDPLGLDLAIGAKPEIEQPEPPPEAKVDVRKPKRLRGRTVIATVSCPAQATSDCRVRTPKKLRLRARGVKKTQRAMLRRGGRLRAPKRVAPGADGRVTLRLAKRQRKILRGKRVRGKLTVRVAVPGGESLSQPVRVAGKVR